MINDFTDDLVSKAPDVFSIHHIQAWKIWLPFRRRYFDNYATKRKHFPRYWPFLRGIHRFTGGFPSQRPVTQSFDVSLIFAWINGWANKRDLVIWDAIAIIMTSLLRLNVFYLMVFSFGCQWSLFSRVGLGWASLLVLSLFWFGQCVCTARQASTIAWANAGPVSKSLYGISVLIDMLSTTSCLCSARSYHVFFKWW